MNGFSQRLKTMILIVSLSGRVSNNWKSELLGDYASTLSCVCVIAILKISVKRSASIARSRIRFLLSLTLIITMYWVFVLVELFLV